MLLAMALLLMTPAQEVSPSWDLRVEAEKIPPSVARLKPLLERLEPGKWVAAGAPQGYEKQWKDCLETIGYVQNAAHRLAERPEKLSLAVETLVRLESLVEHATSLTQAVRRYQNPAIAEVLESEISAAGAGREWLRRVVMDLAAAREQELETAESEAQRCRTQMVKPGARRN